MKASALSAAAIAALLALSAPAVDAFQGPGVARKSQPATSNPAGSNAILPGQIRASKIIGAPLYDKNDEKAGSVADFILDTRGAAVAAVVIDVAMLIGSKTVAVKMSDIAWESNRLVVKYTLRELQRTVDYRMSGDGAASAPSEEAR
ncbi:MAG TPA: PRC-barrel domain-containing protein [Stellaceae bacterium]|nr:PRC-barrel domain-containing protein [Stellaceae bacterium]